MRLLAVTAYWPPHRGGIETVAWEQAHRLAQRGHSVSVLTSRLASNPAYAVEGNVNVHRIPAMNGFEEQCGIPFPLFSYKLVPSLTRLVPAHDVVLIHNHSYLSSVAAALVARIYRRPTVVIQFNPFVHYRFPWNVVEHGADFVLGRHTLRSANRLLAISEHTRRYVRQLVGDRPAEVLRLGVDTRRFTPVRSAAEKEVIRGRLGLPRDSFIVSTVRRLVFRNGLDTLLAAATKLRPQKDVVIVIGGRGPERSVLQRVIEQENLDNVRLIGFVPDELLPDLYRASDAFVLPSRTGEGFGLVLLEAFASGIPAVATRGGGQEEVMREGQTGLLVQPGAPDAMARAILNLRDHPERVKTMGEVARSVAVESDWERCVDQLEGVLTGVLEPPSWTHESEELCGGRESATTLRPQALA